jgi:hypothetical protein
VGYQKEREQERDEKRREKRWQHLQFFWMSPSPSPAEEPFLCTIFLERNSGRSFPTRCTSSLAQLADALIRETRVGAVVGGEGQTLLWKEGEVRRRLWCCGARRRGPMGRRGVAVNRTRSGIKSYCINFLGLAL